MHTASTLLFQIFVVTVSCQDMNKMYLSSLTGPIQLQVNSLRGKNGYLELPGLGRPFTLGALYDAHTDTLIAGPKPWTEDTIKKFSSELPQVQTTSDYVSSDSLDESFNLLDVGAGISASFLAGLVKVSGSGNYLSQKSQSNYEASMTYWFKKKTHLRLIDMDHMNALDYQKVFEENPTATHVVSAITYGGNNFFKFSKTGKSSTDKSIIAGQLKVYASIIVASASGTGHLNLTKEEKKNFSQISCHFSGDVNLVKTPTNFAQALEVVGKLAALVTKETAVPVLVSLLPVNEFDDKLVDRVVEEIEKAQIDQIQDRMAGYDELDRDINDVKIRSPYSQLPQFQHQMDQFELALSQKHDSFQMQVQEKLPAARHGNMESKTELENILKESDSIFKMKKLNNWMEANEAESGALDHLFTWKPDLVISDTMYLNELLLNGEVEFIVSFVIRVYGQNEKFTQCLMHNCEPETVSQTCDPLECSIDTTYVSWLQDKSVTKKVRDVFKQFKEMVEMNDLQESWNTRFIIQSEYVTDEKKQDFFIRIYQDGEVTSKTVPHVTELIMKSHNCSGTRISWNIFMDQSSKDFLDLVSMKYFSLKTPDQVEEYTTTKLQDEFLVPFFDDFAVTLLIKCKFGICSKNNTEVFKNLPGLDDCILEPRRCISTNNEFQVNRRYHILNGFPLLNYNNGMKPEVLDITTPNTGNGAPVGHCPLNETKNQKWLIRPAGKGNIYIVAAESGKVVQLPPNSATDTGVQLELWDLNGGDNQKWHVTPYTSKIDIDDYGMEHYYCSIVNVQNADLALDILKKTNCSPVTQNDLNDNNQLSQQWSFDIVGFIGH